MEYAFPTFVGGAIMWAAWYRDWIWNNYGMFGILVIGIIAALVASFALYLSGLGIRAWRRHSPSVETISTTEPPPTLDWDKPLEKQFRLHFKNQTVSVDGYEFIECTFENATFKYQGTKPFRFHGNNKGNSARVQTDNKIVAQAMMLTAVVRGENPAYSIHKTGTRSGDAEQQAAPADNEIIHPPTVTQSPPSLTASLYVSDIRLTFADLKKDGTGPL